MSSTTLYFLILAVAADPLPARPPAGEPLVIRNVVLTLIEQAEVPSREAGVLISREVPEGQTVEQGQLLGKIDDADAQLRLAKATAEYQQAQEIAANDLQVRFAEKAAEVAQTEYQRAVDAATQLNKSVSQTELDRLQLLAEKARLEIEQAKIDRSLAAKLRDLKGHDRELAALSVAHRRITAPLTGMVVHWRHQKGEWLEPGAPLVRIVRLNRLKAEGFAPAAQLRSVDVGSQAMFVLELPNRERQAFPGELVFISPEIDPVNGQVRFWAEIENPQLELRPGSIGKLECFLRKSP